MEQKSNKLLHQQVRVFFPHLHPDFCLNSFCYFMGQTIIAEDVLILVALVAVQMEDLLR